MRFPNPNMQVRIRSVRFALVKCAEGIEIGECLSPVEKCFGIIFGLHVPIAHGFNRRSRGKVRHAGCCSQSGRDESCSSASG